MNKMKTMQFILILLLLSCGSSSSSTKQDDKIKDNTNVVDPSCFYGQWKNIDFPLEVSLYNEGFYKIFNDEKNAFKKELEESVVKTNILKVNISPFYANEDPKHFTIVPGCQKKFSNYDLILFLLINNTDAGVYAMTIKDCNQPIDLLLLDGGEPEVEQIESYIDANGKITRTGILIDEDYQHSSDTIFPATEKIEYFQLTDQGMFKALGGTKSIYGQYFMNSKNDYHIEKLP